MSNLVTLKLEGLPSQAGHVLLEDFLRRAAGLQTALRCVDRIEGNLFDETLDYRIVDASHRSPLSLTVEMVSRDPGTAPDPNHVEHRHQQFFRVASAIAYRQPLPTNTPKELIDAFQVIAEGAGDKFAGGEIRNGTIRIPLDSSFASNVAVLTGVSLPDRRSGGKYFGEIQGVVHAFFKESRRPHLVVRELSTRALIKCYFNPMMYEKAVETLSERDSVVFVEGEITERADIGIADEIEVLDFRPAPLFDLQFFESFIGSRPDLTGSDSSEDILNHTWSDA